MALLGGALAIACLVLKPVQILTAPPAQDTRTGGSVYCVKGSHDAAKAKSWTLKRALLLAAEPGEIIFNEDELNAWFADSRHTRPAARHPGEFFEIGPPDFRIADGELQIAAPATVNLLSMRIPLLMQMRGAFERGAGGAPLAPGDSRELVMFAPREIFAGSLPLHRLPGARAFLLNEALGQQTLPGEAVKAWRGIERATIAGRELHVRIK